MATRKKTKKPTKKPTSNFIDTSSKWFDKLADAHEYDTKLGKTVGARVMRAASKANLQALVRSLKGKAKWIAPLREHAKRILKGDFKKEFRFAYGGKAHGYAPVSMTSVLFGEIDQA